MSVAATQSLWAALVVDELVRCGVSLVAVCPGSRSTPLVAAIAAHPRLQHRVVTDERSASFWALGAAKASGRPVAMVTTSGSAMAHAHPAVVEAAEEQVPLILISADRPPELRHTGANQTTDQTALFGPHVRWALDLPCPDAQIDPAFVLTTIDHAVYCATRHPAGPVHLNMPLRKPLEPAPYALPDTLASWAASEGPYTRWTQARSRLDDADAGGLATVVAGAERGLLVVGALRDADDRAAARAIAAHLPWPVIADVGSGVAGLAGVDRLLGSHAVREAARPDVVLHLGGRLVSQPVLDWLAERPPRRWIVVQPGDARYDPHHRVTDRLDAPVAALADVALPARLHPGLAALHRAADAADAAVVSTLADAEAATEPGVARALWQGLDAKSVLCVSNSMPIRDLDRYAGPRVGGPQVFTSRGVSGIDGQVATAVGVAEALGAPTTLLIGDQAFTHDIGSLALLASARVPVSVVVVDNDGGGIFSFLPIARHGALHDRFFVAATPHDFAAACAAFGVPFAAVDDGAACVDAIRRASARRRSSVLLVTTDRGANTALHAALDARISDAADAALSAPARTSRSPR